MKRRTGLVSNSSSSSFICIIEEDAFDKAYENLNSFAKNVIDSISSKDTVLGEQVMIISTFVDHSGYGTFDDLSANPEDDQEPFEALDEFISNIPEDNRWDYSMDW